ncbi:Linoleoyl-CoA desaturase [Cronobacter condimenti 1330]|uniref:Linoleoyl-CoA desaturase n=1 Tax=Cronobacter condimenti 1330 TaxID=1073999 RepID=K7ZZP7_9ENTR|nr:acyl-CoA desaturase [Cronobacter condimenti]ALB63050.1 linoleoyl-CoA desaturase [Cronobacter condimenti 1330]CCJ71805.1 Linoleoyl-CoA desaturase [Cronobacter condimenti 1330]
MPRNLPTDDVERHDPALHKAFRTACQRYLATRRDHRFANPGMWLKLVFLALCGAVCYSLCLTSSGLFAFALCYVGFLFFAMMLVVNVLHDASHNAFCRSARANAWLGRIISVPLGLDADSWQVRHVQFHHPYTNIQGYDPDIDENGVLCQTPFQRWKPVMRYQHLYWPLVTALTFPWYAWYMDWRDRLGETAFTRHLPHPGAKGVMLFLLLKGAHFLLALGLPALTLAGTVSLPGLLAVYLASQMLVSALFVSLLIGTHWAKGHFYPTPEKKAVPHSPYHHAFATTFDWETRPRLLGYWLGGLNLHLTHHLFPAWSHRHFAALSVIIDEVASQHSLEYRRVSVGDLLRLQRGHLKRMGKGTESTATDERQR